MSAPVTSTNTPTSTAPAPTNTPTETPSGGTPSAEPKSYRDKILEKAGVKSFGDFHPRAQQIRDSIKPRTVDAPADVQPDTRTTTTTQTTSNTEFDELKRGYAAMQAELAQLKAQAQAKPDPQEQAKDEPAKPKPSENPHYYAAAEYLGDGAADKFVNRAARVIEELRAWQAAAANGDDKQKAAAANRIRMAEERLEDIADAADKDRQIAELKARLDKQGQAPAVDVDKAKAWMFDPAQAGQMTQLYPRLAHALKTGATTREKLEKRIDRIPVGDDPKAWGESVDSLFADMDELFPDPPADANTPSQTTTQTTTTETVPVNLASRAPSRGNGQAGQRPPVRDYEESRAVLLDRWRAQGPITRASRKSSKG